MRFASDPFPDRAIGDVAFDMGLMLAASEDGTSPSQVLGDLQEGNPHRHAQVRHQIARALSCCLRWEATDIRSIHVIGSAVEGQARRASDLDLVIRVPEEDARLEASLELINQDLTDAFREAVGSVSQDFLLLDLHYVTDEDFESPGGISVALESPNVPRFPINPLRETVEPDAPVRER